MLTITQTFPFYSTDIHTHTKSDATNHRIPGTKKPAFLSHFRPEKWEHIVPFQYSLLFTDEGQAPSTDPHSKNLLQHFTAR